MPIPVINPVAEVWKAVVGYEGLYSVSNHGRVRSEPRLIRCKLVNTNRRRLAGRILRPNIIDVAGHQSVALCLDGVVERRAPYCLALEAFIGPRPRGMQCCHIDGDPTNNRLENLRWGTAADNAADRDSHGRTIRGERHKLAKLSDDDAALIRAALAAGTGAATLATRFGVSRTIINRIKKGVSYCPSATRARS